MKTIYSVAGEAKECDAVDAREHIASGRWFAEAHVAVENVETQPEESKAEETPRRGHPSRNNHAS